MCFLHKRKNWPWKVVFLHPPWWIYVSRSLWYRAAATRYWPIVFMLWYHWSFLMYHSKFTVVLLLFLTKKNVSSTFTFVFERKFLQLQRRKWTRQLSWKGVVRNGQILWHCGSRFQPKKKLQNIMSSLPLKRRKSKSY